MCPERSGGRTVPPVVRLIVLNYNGGNLVRVAVESLTSLDWPPERLDIVMVDNHSSDGSDIDVERLFPSVRVVRADTNLGFSANNLAMRDLDGVDYVGLINNDASVEPSWLRSLVDTLESDPGLGAACPRILFAPSFAGATISSPTFRPRGDRRDLGTRVSGVQVDGCDAWGSLRFGLGFYGQERGPASEPRFRWTGANAELHVPLSNGGPPPSTLSVRLAAPAPTPVTVTSGDRTVEADIGADPTWVEVPLGSPVYDLVNNTGSVLTSDGFGADRGYLEPDAGQYDGPSDVFAWCGAGVVLARRYLDDVGLFDDRFFLYYEDTDLSWRGQAQGWRYRYVPTAIQRHVHAATSIEGSPLFEYHVARNRLVMLAKNAPFPMTLRASGRFLRATAGAARHDLVTPLLRGRRPSSARVRLRTGSFLGFVGLLPGIVRERRTVRRAAAAAGGPLVSGSSDR